jgi:hypothetical protein
MAQLQIPQSQEPALERIVALTDAEFGQLLSALGDAAPTLHMEAWAKTLSPKIGLDEKSAFQVLELLGTLYRTRTMFGQTVERFAHGVCEALRSSENLKLRPADGDWERLHQRFVSVLGLDRSLGITAKAIDVMVKSQNIFQGARILTNLRPIYGEDVTLPPGAGVIVHEILIMHFADGCQSKTSHFAADVLDLQRLRDVIDRAIAKEESLKACITKAGMLPLEASDD